MSIGYPPDVPTYGDPYEPFRNPRISRGVRRNLRAFIEAVIPRNERYDFDLVDPVLHYVERFLTYLPGLLGWAFPWGIRLVAWWGFLAMGLRPFHRATVDRRRAYLERLAHSRVLALRDLFRGIKAIVYLAYYEHPQVMERMGYDHAAHVRRMIQLRKERYDLDVA